MLMATCGTKNDEYSLFRICFGDVCSPPDGGIKVSGPSDVRLPNKLLRRLFSLECLPVAPAGLVGVGGSSSLLD